VAFTPLDHPFKLDDDVVQWFRQQPKEFFADGIHCFV
jgi:hypothetical protein